MAYTVSLSNRFKKDFRRCIKRGLNMKHITDAMDLLEATGMLPAKYRPHKLSGDKDGQWECHIEPDWLMTDWMLSIRKASSTFVSSGMVYSAVAIAFSTWMLRSTYSFATFVSSSASSRFTSFVRRYTLALISSPLFCPFRGCREK